MTDQERFEIVLSELGKLILALGDLRENIKVIGGQVIALEERTRGRSGVLDIQLATGPTISRGFSFDIDLLYEYAETWQDERLPHVLKQLGYNRSHDTRWIKEVDSVSVAIDLLAPPDIPRHELPTPMAPANRGEMAAARVPRQLAVRIGDQEIEVPVPDAPSFLDLKLGAKADRPGQNKDYFDIFAYVNLIGPREVSRQLLQSRRNMAIKTELRENFCSETSEGVRDVLAYASTLEDADRALVVRYVIDLFEELLAEGG